MQIKIFDISSIADDQELEDINKFIRSNRVLDIDKHFYLSSNNVARWSIFITYLAQQNNQQHISDKKAKVDYKEILSEEEFGRFVKLRAIRKQLAENDAVPAYAVFSDFELSEISKLPSIEIPLLKKISGVGEKRVEKYGALICEKFKEDNE